jgi:hypothetical protein
MKFTVMVRTSTGDIVKRHLTLVAEKLVTRLRETTPGKRSSEWKTTVRTDSAVVSHPAGYYRYLEQGTGLYGPNHAYIVPKTAKALHWTSGGKDIFVKRSRGIKPQKFISAAISEVTR